MDGGSRGGWLEAEDLEEHGGRGVVGIVEGERIRAGSRAFLEEAYVEVPADLDAKVLPGQGARLDHSAESRRSFA